MEKKVEPGVFLMQKKLSKRNLELQFVEPQRVADDRDGAKGHGDAGDHGT
jgi:hypothetical protein